MQLIKNISKEDLVEIKKILITNDLSTYKLNKKDFILYKKNKIIIAFGRIYKIDEINYELSSVWVKKDFRGNKIGLKIIKELLVYKKKYNNLFLATKNELEDYYKKVGFEKIKINSNIPKRFKATLEWAKKENIEAIIMKFNK